jgi:general secretion pathway protein M
MSALSLPVRRFAALGLLAIGVLLLWEMAISPVVDLWDRMGNDNASSSRLLAAYQKIIRDEPAWAALLEHMQEEPYADLFIDSDDPDLAAARLQQQIKQVTEASHGNIGSIQILPAGKDQALQHVGVRVNFTIPLKQIAHVFEAYDKDRPYVFVDNLLITAPEGMPNTGTEPLLSVNCDLYSYVRPITP